ncbi:hypothetical protein MEO_01211 [Candida albicans P94015]|nr:hypothetical protein MEO_01211 [Candida albicans P94015]
MEIDKSVCNSISHFKLSFLILINYPVDFLALLVCTKSNVGIPKKKKEKKKENVGSDILALILLLVI